MNVMGGTISVIVHAILLLVAVLDGVRLLIETANKWLRGVALRWKLSMWEGG
jgi:hypothetical protein